MIFDYLLSELYEDRKIGRYEADWGFISTAAVNDSNYPYETAVKHKEYNDNKIVIVDNYSTQNDAINGHQKWVEAMTGEVLPERLVDVGEAQLAQTLEILSEDQAWRIHPRQPK